MADIHHDFPTSDDPVSPSVKAETDRIMEEILLSLKVERAVIFVKVEGRWHLASSHEVAVNDFWNLAPLSLSVIHSAAQGETIHLMDAIGDSSSRFSSTSVILTGIRSVACVPYKSESGEVLAILYADNRFNKGIFSSDDVSTLQSLAAELGGRLFEEA